MILRSRMAVSFDHLLIKHSYKANEELTAEIKSGHFLSNGHFYFLTPERTVHYKALSTGNYEPYVQYLKDAGDTDHSEETFKTLLHHFSLETMPIIWANIYGHTKKFWIQDGNHRLAILKYKQLFGDVLPLKYLRVDYYPDVQEQLKAALKRTVSNDQHYNGWHNRTEFGYHSFDLYTIQIPGQRNPKQRLEKVKPYYDFTNKTVLDLGCNTGGMLFHIPEIKRGVGLDFDQKCIDSCEVFKSWLLLSAEFHFHQVDLNDIQLLSWCAAKELQPDIIFILSLGSWVTSWKKLYAEAFYAALHLLLETNNDEEGKPQLRFFEELGATITLVSDKSDDDSTGNHKRKTYLIRTLKHV